MSELTSDEITELLYDVYCENVGVNFNGDKLPSWDEFVSDPNKVKQANAWKAVGRAAKGIYERE